jgi:hypothetical protein
MGWTIVVQFPVELEILFDYHLVQTAYVAHPANVYQIIPRV